MTTKTILVIEDDRTVARMLKDVLEAEGFAVLCERDGEFGLRTLLEKKPDLVITDVLIPKIKGFDLIQKIRDNEKTAATPIIVISGVYRSAMHKERITEKHKIAEYLDKPIDIDRVIDVLHDLFSSAYPDPPERLNEGAVKRAPNVRETSWAHEVSKIVDPKDKPAGIDPLDSGPKTGELKASEIKASELRASEPKSGDLIIPSNLEIPAAQPIGLSPPPSLRKAVPRVASEERAVAFAGIETHPKGAPIKGDLADAPFARVFGGLFAARATGALLLRKGSVKKIVYLRQGIPVFVKSNLLNECLGRVMVAERLITQEECDRSLEIKKTSTKKQGEILVEMGSISPHNLEFGLELQMQAKLFDIFSWLEGKFQFNPREEYEGPQVALSLAPTAMIYEGATRAMSAERVRRELARIEDRTIAPAKDPTFRYQALELDPRAARVIDRIDGKRTLKSALDEAGVDGDPAQLLVYALCCTSMLCVVQAGLGERPLSNASQPIVVTDSDIQPLNTGEIAVMSELAMSVGLKKDDLRTLLFEHTPRPEGGERLDAATFSIAADLMEPLDARAALARGGLGVDATPGAAAGESASGPHGGDLARADAPSTDLARGVDAGRSTPGADAAHATPSTDLARGADAAHTTPSADVVRGADAARSTPSTDLARGADAARSTPSTDLARGADAARSTPSTDLARGADAARSTPSTDLARGADAARSTPSTDLARGADAARSTPSTELPRSADAGRSTPSANAPRATPPKLPVPVLPPLPLPPPLPAIHDEPPRPPQLDEEVRRQVRARLEAEVVRLAAERASQRPQTSPTLSSTPRKPASGPKGSSRMPAGPRLDLERENVRTRKELTERFQHMRAQSCYDLLNVSRRASNDDIRSAEQRLLRDHHPDRVVPGTSSREIRLLAESIYLLIVRAYEVLVDPDARRAHDSALGQQTEAKRIAPLVQAEEVFERGKRAAESGQWDLARELFREASEMSSTEGIFVAHYALATLASSPTSQDAEAQAIALFDRATSLSPRSEQVFLLRGMLHQKLGKKAEAIRDFEAALRLDPDSIDALRALRTLEPPSARKSSLLSSLFES